MPNSDMRGTERDTPVSSPDNTSAPDPVCRRLALGPAPHHSVSDPAHHSHEPGTNLAHPRQQPLPRSLQDFQKLSVEGTSHAAPATSVALVPHQNISTSASGIGLSFTHSYITAGGDIGSKNTNVSQQGTSNISIGNESHVHIHHTSRTNDHKILLDHINDTLRSYTSTEAILSKDVHGEPSLCHTRTRKGLLEDTVTWVVASSVADKESNDVSRRARCIVGAPGSGKSTIMNTLIIDRDWLQDAAHRTPGLIAAHYYIRRSLHATTDGSKVLPTLTLQLARRNPGVAQHVSGILDTAIQTGVFAPHFQEDLFLEAIRAYSSTVLIIIDALDEASNPFSLATTLSRVIPRSPINLRLLLATRNEHGVLRGLGRDLAASIVHEIPTEESIGEVRDYIRRRLRDGVTDLFGNNPAWDHWPDDSQIRRLSERAGGLYIWAATAVDYILSKIRRHGKARRDRWIKGVESIGTADVNRLYMFILEKQLKSEEEDHQEDDTRQDRITGVLGLIVIAEHPLSLADLVALLAFDDFDVDHFVNMMRSILVPGTETITESTIPRMHKTFFDFITTKRASAFRVDIEHHHRKTANQCFALMDTHLRFNVYGVSSSFQAYDTRALVRRLPGGLLYASTRWWYHVQRGQKGSLERLFPHLDFIQTLFFDKLLFWLEVVSNEEGFSAAQSCISDLVKHLRSCTCCRMRLWTSRMRRRVSRRLPKATRAEGIDLADFADEAQSLMEKYKACILGSVPHIYVSLLGFTTASSAVASHYRKTVGTMVIPCPYGATSNWYSWDARPETVDDGKVFAISFSPCGRRLAAGYASNRIRVWDVETGECPLTMGPLKNPGGGINSVCFSPSGLLIASGSVDKTIRVWDADTGKSMLGPLTNHSGRNKTRNHTGRVFSVSFSPDSTHIASGSDDDAIRVWDVRTGNRVLGPLQGHRDSIGCVSYSPDGSCIASGSNDKTIRLWDAQTGACICGPLEGHGRWVLSLSFHPDGRRLVSGSRDTTLRIWDTQNGTCIHDPLTGHTDWVRSVSFSPDGRYIVSGADDSTIRIWDAEAAVCVAGPFGGASNFVSSVAFSPDSVYLAAGSWDGTVRLWDFGALLGVGMREPVREDQASARVEITDHTQAVHRKGWTLGPKGELLFWAPEPRFHSAIWRPSTVRILGRPTMINVSHLATGEEWLKYFPIGS